MNKLAINEPAKELSCILVILCPQTLTNHLNIIPSPVVMVVIANCQVRILMYHYMVDSFMQ